MIKKVRTCVNCTIKITNLTNHHMQKILFKIASLAVIGILFTSCSNEKIATSVIPLDATMVMAIDIQSLAEKGELSELGNMSSFKSLEREVRSENREMFNLLEDLKEDPSSAGIDLRDPIYFFTVPDGDDFYTAIAMHLLDDDDFGVFMERILDDRSTPSYQKDASGDYINYMVRNSMNISYDGDKALFLMHSNKRNEELFGVRDELMDLETKETILENEIFEDFMNDQKDISFYISTNFITGNRRIMSEISNLPYDLSNNTVMAFLDFQDGKIELSGRTALNDDITKMQDEYPMLADSFNEELLKYIAAESIAIGSMAINTENYLKLLDKTKGTSDEYNRMNDIMDEMDLKSVLKKLDGSIVASYNGMEQREVEVMSWYSEEPYKVMKSSPKIAVVVGIKDQTYFKNKMANLLEADMTVEDGLQVINMDGAALYLSYNKSSMMLSTNKTDALNHQSGKGVSKSLKGSETAKTMKDSPIFMTMEMNATNLTQQLNANELGQLAKSLKAWDNMMDKIELKTDRDNTMALSLYMKDDSKNSLAQLIAFAEQVYREGVTR